MFFLKLPIHSTQCIKMWMNVLLIMGDVIGTRLVSILRDLGSAAVVLLGSTERLHVFVSVLFLIFEKIFHFNYFKMALCGNKDCVLSDGENCVSCPLDCRDQACGKKKFTLFTVVYL